MKEQKKVVKQAKIELLAGGFLKEEVYYFFFANKFLELIHWAYKSWSWIANIETDLMNLYIQHSMWKIAIDFDESIYMRMCVCGGGGKL